MFLSPLLPPQPHLFPLFLSVLSFVLRESSWCWWRTCVYMAVWVGSKFSPLKSIPSWSVSKRLEYAASQGHHTHTRTNWHTYRSPGLWSISSSLVIDQSITTNRDSFPAATQTRSQEMSSFFQISPWSELYLILVRIVWTQKSDI